MLSKFSAKKGECIIIWKIENFSLALKKFPEDICAVRFCSEMIDYTNWVLSLLTDTENSENMTCLIKRNYGGPETVTIAFEIIALSPDGNDLLLTEVTTHSFDKDRDYTSAILQENTGSLKKHLWKGTLILKCCLKKTGCEDLVSKTSFARSRSELEKKDFLWTLKRYSSEEQKCQNTLIALKSIYGMKSLKVELVCKRSEEFLSIRISTDDYLRKRTYVTCKISLLNSKGKPLANAEDEYVFEKLSSSGSTWRFPKFIKKSMLTDFVFHLKFNLTVFSTGGETEVEESSYEFPLDQEMDSSVRNATLSSDLLRLFSEQKSCDVILKIGDKEFGAHKNILSSRSPIFDSMFQNDMLEKNTGIVNITDVDGEILNMLLEYVYADKLEDLEMEKAMKLYQAADKYQILSLKDKCSSLLKWGLTSGNVFRVLAFADDYQDDSLRMAVKNFICIFGYELLDSDIWRNFMAERVHLAADIMHQVTINCLKIL